MKQKQTTQEIIIKRAHDKDIRTKIELPRIPQRRDILVLHEEHANIVPESETMKVKVLSIRTRFDLNNPDNPQTEIVTKLINP
jgi:hypothetical protein